jgi:hypothetical protein
MTAGDTAPLPVGTRLPPLVSHADTGELHWRDPARGATVAVFLQSADRAADLDYLRGLDSSARDFRAWDGRVIVVMPDQADQAARAGAADRTTSISVVTEPEGEAEHCGVRGGEDAILIADRWGQIYHGARGSTPDALPTPAEIEEWLQYLATQCPECGVIDEP